MTYTIRNVSIGFIELLINISSERIEGVRNLGSVICPSLRAIEMSISLHLRHKRISPKFLSWWRRMRKVIDKYGREHAFPQIVMQCGPTQEWS